MLKLRRVLPAVLVLSMAYQAQAFWGTFLLGAAAGNILTSMLRPNSSTYTTTYGDKYTEHNASTYINVTPIANGLDKVAGAIREDISEEYIQRMIRRHPEMKKIGMFTGIHPDSAEATVF